MAFLILTLAAALVLAGCAKGGDQTGVGDTAASGSTEPTAVVVEDIATPTQQAQEPEPAATPEPTPSIPKYGFEGVNLEGEAVIIEDLFGQDTLLWFWAPW